MLSRMRRRFLLAILSAILSSVTSAQSKEDYGALLKRVQQGDMTVDFRAFRIAGVLASWRPAATAACM
jgi:hypothetical protein